MFECRKVDIDFCDTAYWKFETVVEIDAPADEVWKILTESCWKEWHPEVSGIKWLTPLPRGVGSQRNVGFSHWLFMILMFGSLVIKEQFIVWEENKRMAFRFEHTNRPYFLGVHAAVEDFALETLDTGKTKFTRKVYFEPSYLMFALIIIVKPTLQGIFSRAAENLRLKFENKVYPKAAMTSTDVEVRGADLTIPSYTNLGHIPYTVMHDYDDSIPFGICSVEGES